MIRLFSSAILCQLTIWSTVTASPVPSDVPDEVTLRILNSKLPELVVPLIKINSYLANENLPVWLVDGSEPEKLKPNTEIMKNLGPFSMYQHKETSSAAVYFHRPQEFHGTIDMSLVIESLHIQDVTGQIKVGGRWSGGVIKRPVYMYRHVRSISKNENDTIISGQSSEYKNTGMTFANETESATRTRRDIPDVVYVELLVIINYDLLDTMSIIYQYDSHATLVSDVLTLINSADMLYSKIPEPDIRLNIAGIVIGTDRESFPTLSRCESATFREQTNPIHKSMELTCTGPAIETYLQQQSNVISPDSYDVAMLLTSYTIRDKSLFPFQRPKYSWGVTMVGPDGPYKSKRNRQITFPVITVDVTENFGSFATVAHEVSHALRNLNHDDEPYVDEAGNCCGHIMRTGGGFCADCLSWSPATKKHFKKFFSSRNGCFFLNKPRSLKKYGPHEIWTADQQCQCYGYKSAGSLKKTLLESVCRTSKLELCDRKLNCVDENNKSFGTPFPSDGTPCSEDNDLIRRVCWSRKCVPVPHLDDMNFWSHSV